MTLFNSQSVVVETVTESPVTLQYTTEGITLPFDEVQEKTIRDLFEEYADEMGIPATSVAQATFRTVDGPISGDEIIRAGMTVVASITHDSKGES
jgi:uncharacterized NAD-dependent epimerase/dehydratase family protein